MNRLLRAWYAQLRNCHNKKRAADDTDQGTQETEYDDRQGMLPFVKAKQRLESLPHERKTDKDDNNTAHQRKLVDWTRRLAYTTGALALATFIVACFSGWQAWEMRSGADQQHTDTIAALGKTDATIAAMKSQADIMGGQLNEMEIARRPWVTADINLGGELMMRDGGPVEIQTIITLRNPGQTPATETSISGVGFLPIAPFTTAENALACQQADLPIQRGMSIGPNVFPGDRKILDYTFSITKDRVEAYWTQSPAMKPTLFPFLVVCVAYKEHAGGKIHHTSFAFQILGVTKPIRATEMPIPISELRFRTFPFGTLPPD